MELPLPPSTTYDQVARYLLVRRNALIVRWMLRLHAEQMRFDEWMQTQLSLPGVAERICDGIARLADLQRGGLPFAAILEIQTRPDPNMPGRLMLAGGLCWLLVKPTDLPGDRYELVGIVINLTGTGDSARDCKLGTAEWTLRPCEWNLGSLDAGEVLEQIAGGTAPGELLAFIPLMQRGGDPGIIKRWLEIAGEEQDLRRRGDYALAVVFADLFGIRPLWQNALEGFTVIESPMVAEWRAEGKREGMREGEVKAKIDAVVRVVQGRYKELPEDLVATIRASTDVAQLDGWLDTALKARTLKQFRKQTGI